MSSKSEFSSLATKLCKKVKPIYEKIKLFFRKITVRSILTVIQLNERLPIIEYETAEDWQIGDSHKRLLYKMLWIAITFIFIMLICAKLWVSHHAGDAIDNKPMGPIRIQAFSV